MAAETTNTANELPRNCAARALRVMPTFHRWATTQVLNQRLGGDLSLRQLTVLYLIRDETPTLGHIARRLMVTPAVVTGIVDRLEKRGFVQRRADAEDRRVVRLILTEAGREKSMVIEDKLVADVALRLTHYPTEQVAELERGLMLLERVLAELDQAEGEGTRTALAVNGTKI